MSGVAGLGYERIFPGGGAVAELLRGHPWEQSPLGPPERWAPELRTSLRITLLSRFPILLWWGPDLIMLYNDTYSAIIADKHPWALGRPGREVFPEIWDVIGPMLEGVSRAESSTWSDDQYLALDRRGFVEEAYFTFSYSPIITQQGSVGGVFTVVSETTERVLAHRRLELLRRISARGASASSEDEAVAVVMEEVAGATRDVPLFGLCRRAAGDLGWASLTLDPAEVPVPDGAGDPLGVAEALATRGAVERSLSGAGVVLPPWPEAVATVVTVPLPMEREKEWAMVAGLSPRLAPNEAYRGFLELLAVQVGAVLAGAWAVASARRRADALAELDRAKTAFFANVSHELRTPLTLILSPLEEARDRAEGLAPDEVEVAHRNAERLLDLVNVVLDFASLETGGLDARFAPTDLSRLTADVASGFRSLCARAGLELHVETPPLAEPVFVDVRLWESVVLNLLANAFKATLRGGISIRLEARDRGVELSVADTGVGIPADEIPRLFDRFYRVRGQQGRTIEGAGIGLSMTRELVTLHGGRIDVESEPGRGSTFRVWLPFGRGHLDPARITERPDPRPSRAPAVLAAANRWLPEAGPRGPSAPGGRLAAQGHVLVVDDNADMRDYLVRLLSDDGWRVTDVPSAEAALDALETESPDVLVTDVMLPRMDGFELVRAVRGRGHLDVSIVLLSARAGKEAIADGLARGADDYIVKPFAPLELLGRVRSHVELARSRSDLARSRRVLQELEGERARVARDLHDGIGQSLLALRLALQNGASNTRGPAGLIGDVDRTLEILRAVAHDLRPPALDELGLTAALASLVRHMGGSAGMVTSIELPEMDVAPTVAPTVYRIVQEALANAVRHAQAGRVWLRGGPTDEGFGIAVLDDGCGFDPLQARKGHGLSNMRERAAMIGGALDIRRGTDGGTCVELIVPAPSRDAAWAGRRR